MARECAGPSLPKAAVCTFRNPAERSMFARCFAASWLGMIDILLFNGELFSVYDGVVTWTRDESTVIGAVFLLALLLVARWCPKRIRPFGWSVAAIASCVAGGTLCAVGAVAAEPVPIVVGVLFFAVADAWGLVVWLLACSQLDKRQLCVCFAAPGALAVPVAFAMNLWAPYPLLNALSCLCVIATVVLCAPLTRSFFERLVAMGVPAEQAVVHPQAFLPLGHTFYVYIFGFSVAYGFALRCENMTSSGVVSGMTLLTLAIIAVYGWRAKGQPRADTLFVGAYIAVSVGFMLILLDDGRTEGCASALLVAGYMCSQLLAWFALCAAAARNTVDAIPTICWGTAIGYIGIMGGVGLWMVPNVLLAPILGEDRLLQGVMVTIVFGCLLLYTVLTWRTFSFDATIEGIAPDQPPVVVRYVDTLDERCARAAELFTLTSREADVMRLLAHGNNTSRIQEELGIKGNTVKYHVKNIYAKLGVHSQQELIDRVGEQ